jgi:CheY-like chemotaxis protein
MKRIVVAESSPTIKSVADSLLRQSGYDVLCTSDGLQAWEIISAEKPDLVLTGLTLSGLSGLELCHQVTNDPLTGGIPVVLMIGASDATPADELLACGSRGRLKKPFSPKDLLEIVGRLVGQQGQYLEASPRPAVPEIKETKFMAQVSTDDHDINKRETYNLEWLDLSDSTPSKQVSRIASLDLSKDDQGLVIDDDQYGLYIPQLIEEEPQEPVSPLSKPEEEAQKKDSDYDWFVGEMKREIEGKSSDKLPVVKPNPPEPPTPDTLAGFMSNMGFEDIRSAATSEVPPTVRRDPAAPLPIDSTEKIPIPPGPAAGGISALDSRSETRLSPQIAHHDVEAIAGRVATRLAALIAARIDKDLIVEVIRTELEK